MSLPANGVTVPMVNAADTTATASGSVDVSVIITVAASIGGLFLVILIIFIIFVVYFYRKQLSEDEFDKKKSSLNVNRLDWKTHSLAHQFGDVDDIDEMLWTDRGRESNAHTNNPAFDKDFEPLDVNNLKAFDSADDDAISARETESSNDLVEINMEEDEPNDPTASEGDDAERKKQISILDMKTWGQPGISRHNSMQSIHGCAPPDAVSNDWNSLRSQDGGRFPFVSPGGIGQHNSTGSQGGFPFTVSQPSNDPRFQYTRTNPLVSRNTADRFPVSRGDNGGYTPHEQRDFGGVDDIESVEFDRSSTLRSSRRNQSVVDFYESGTRTTGSSFSLALEGSGSLGRNLLWQSKQFGGMGSTNTT